MTKLTKQQQLDFEKSFLIEVNSLIQKTIRVQNNEEEKINHKKTDIWLENFVAFLTENKIKPQNIYNTELKNIAELISFAISQREKGNKSFFEKAEREGFEIRQQWQKENL